MMKGLSEVAIMQSKRVSIILACITAEMKVVASCTAMLMWLFGSFNAATQIYGALGKILKAL